MLILCIIISNANAQKLQLEEVNMPLSKTAKKKGMYVSTTQTRDGDILTFVSYDLKKGELGFDVLKLKSDGTPMPVVSEIASKATEAKYGIEIPASGSMPNPAKGVKVLRLVTSNGMLGKLKMEEGYFEPRYKTSIETSDYGTMYVTTYTKVLKGYKFKDTDQTTSDMRLNIYAAHCEPGVDLEKSYAIIEGLVPNTIGYYDMNGSVGFVGKDARNLKDSPNAQNVVISGLFNAKTKTFSNIKEHVFEYNQMKVTDGDDGKGNRTVLISALNAPSTIKAHAKWQAKGVPYMSFISFDTKGNVIDKVTFKSKSIRGNFGICGNGKANFVLGLINSSHTGYYRADVGVPDAFQIVKIVGSEVTEQNVYSLDELSKMAVFPGKKGKFKLKVLTFTGYEEAPNHDMLAFAQNNKNYYVFQFDPDANLKAVYMIPMEENPYSIQTIDSNGKVYVLFREQTGAISQGIKKRVSRGAGYMKDVTFSRVDELMTHGKVIRIDPGSKTCSEPLDIYEDVIMGKDPMFLGDGALILPLKNPKKKIYKMAVIQ